MRIYAAVEASRSRVPTDWQVIALKWVAKLKEKQNLNADAELLSLRNTGELTQRGHEVQPPSPEYVPRYWLVTEGDLVVNPMWLAGGAVGVSRVSGAVSPDYRVYELASSLEPRFVHHLLRSAIYHDQYRLLMRAETTFDRRVTKEDFGGLPLLLPSRVAQRQIAAFLDAETVRLDGLIARKRKLIASLLARRYALVSHRTLSNSTNWTASRLKHVAQINVRALSESEDPDFEFRYIDIGAVSRGRLTANPVTLRFGDAPSRARRIVRPGDTLISTVRTYLRCVWSLREEAQLPTIASTGFAVVTPNCGIDPKFLAWWAEADACIESVLKESVGVSYPAIRPGDLANLPILVPPKSEQRAIADELEGEVAAIEKARGSIEVQLALLQEHRQALIAAAVTGQLDVAKVAA